MMTKMRFSLIFICFAALLLLAGAQSCGTPLDPEPYALLSDATITALLKSTSLNLGSSLGSRVTVVILSATCKPLSHSQLQLLTQNVVSYANNYAYYTPGRPDFTDFSDNKLVVFFKDWGYIIRTSEWTSNSVRIDFLPGKVNGVPLSRLYLIPLGESVVSGKNVQLMEYTAPLSWDLVLPDSPRTALIKLDYAPRDELGMQDLLVKWFCERNITVEIQYGGLESANPILLVKEVLPPMDECLTNTHACERTCVDGQYPNPGYTCQDAVGDKFIVNEIGMSFYSLVRTLLPQANITALGYRMIELWPPPSKDATYTIAIDRNLNGLTIDDVLPGFRAIFGTLVQPLNPARIEMSFVQDTFVLHFDSPEYATVRWTGPYNATSGFAALKLAIYQILKLDPDLASNHDLFDPEYNETKRELSVWFREDMRLATDTSYQNRSCTFGQALFDKANRESIEKLGFTIEGMWRMPETNLDGCPLIAPNDPLAPLRRNDGSLNPLYIGLIAGAIVLLVIIVIVVVVVVLIKKKGWKKAPTVV